MNTRSSDAIPSDFDLVAQAKNDPEAFGALIRRYQEPLFRYARRFGQLPNEDTEDLLQEAFIKMYRHLNEYDSSLKFSSWAYRIVHNQIVDHFRKLKARVRTDALEDYEWEKLIAGNTDIGQELMDRDCVENIKSAINALPSAYREVLLLRFIEDKDYEEIMDILKKPKGTVATLIARGKKLIRETMQQSNHPCR
ncbi:MAG: RNA polymerase sigma factor [Candidatus Moraniibacteriota bacterium]